MRKKFDDIFSLVDTIHQRVRRTDIGRQQRPRLRIASRGKNEILKQKK